MLRAPRRRRSAISSASCTGRRATATPGSSRRSGSAVTRVGTVVVVTSAAVIPATPAGLSFGPVRQPAGLRQRPVLRFLADLRQRPGLRRPTSGQAYGTSGQAYGAAARPTVPGQATSTSPARRPVAPAPAPAPAGDEAPPAPEVPRRPGRPRRPRPPRPPRRLRPPTVPRAACSSRPRRVTEHPALRACLLDSSGPTRLGGGRDGRNNLFHDGPRIAMRGPFFVRKSRHGSRLTNRADCG